MFLQVLGSSSAGNGYILDTGRHALLIEAGVSIAEIKKAVNFDISRIQGCIITHEHGDHAAHAKSVSSMQIPVFGSVGTLEATGLANSYNATSMNAYKWHRVGEFSVLPIPVKHDAAEPFGYYIHHRDMGNLLFLTDFCMSAEDRLPEGMEIDHLMIECNYSKALLDENTLAGKISIQRRNRVVQSHCSLELCKAIVGAEIQEGWTRNIILLHLSGDNSDVSQFHDEIAEITSTPIYIARKGLKIPLKKF